ncbi:MAG: class II aldolase/adducin family protein, partial [Casimicrobiaceae bacterium]
MAAAEAGAGSDEATLRLAIIATALQMNALGINRGKSGNVSARIDDGFLITPSALPYDETRPEDIVTVREDG